MDHCIHNQPRNPIKSKQDTTNTTPHTSADAVWQELKHGCYSLATQQLIIEFLNLLWWSPEQLATLKVDVAALDNAGEALAHRMLRKLLNQAETERADIEEAATGSQPAHTEQVALIMGDLHKEQQRQAALDTPEENIIFMQALSALVDNAVAWKCFQDYVAARTDPLNCAVLDTDAAAEPEASSDAPQLSRHQQDVFHYCHQLGALFFARQQPVPGFKLRTFPLIVGPTGAGKSHLVRTLAQAHDCDYLPITYGAWQVQGSKADTCTIELIAQRAAKGRVLVHLDELDKMRAGFSSSWDISVLNDVWDLLQQSISLQNMSFTGDAAVKREQLEATIRQNVWVVASGTWQEAFEAPRQPVGFGEAAACDSPAEAALERIEKMQLVPPELIARLNSNIQVLTYPSAQEVAGFLAKSGVTLSADEVHSLADGIDRYGFRAVENWITDYSIRQLAARPKQPEAVPTPDTEAAPAHSTARNYVFTVAPLKNDVRRIVQIEAIDGTQVQLKWLQARSGKGTDGFVHGYEAVPHMQVWDAFARKRQLPLRQTVSMTTFASWRPHRMPRPPRQSLNHLPADLYRLWSALAEPSAALTSDDAVTIEQLYSTVYTTEQAQAIREDRQRVAAAVLCSPLFEQTTEPGYAGPNISEILQQCNADVSAGVVDFYHTMSDHSQAAPSATELYNWENQLIDQVLEQLDGDAMPICEQLCMPKSLCEYFKQAAPRRKWQQLSGSEQQAFISVLEAQKSRETE